MCVCVSLPPPFTHQTHPFLTHHFTPLPILPTPPPTHSLHLPLSPFLYLSLLTHPYPSFLHLSLLTIHPLTLPTYTSQPNHTLPLSLLNYTYPFLTYLILSLSLSLSSLTLPIYLSLLSPSLPFLYLSPLPFLIISSLPTLPSLSLLPHTHALLSLSFLPHTHVLLSLSLSLLPFSSRPLPGPAL